MTSETSVKIQPTRSRAPVATLVVTAFLALYWAVLFYGTHTKLPQGLLPGNSDKFVHCIAYTGLGVLLMALRATRGSFPWYSVLARWTVLAVYGAFDELTQLLVNRNADIIDWFFDLIGAAFGLGLVTFLCWRFRRSPRPVTPGRGLG